LGAKAPVMERTDGRESSCLTHTYKGAGMSTQADGNILPNELLTVKEVADYLRVSRVTAWRWCQQGVIPAFRIGRNWRIRREDLLDLERASAYSPEHPMALGSE
jgi:excisionase family DNA binding protein